MTITALNPALLCFVLANIGCGDDTVDSPNAGGKGGGAGAVQTGGEVGGGMQGGGAGASQGGTVGTSGTKATGGAAGAPSDVEACAAWCYVLVPPCYVDAQVPECRAHCANTIKDERSKGCDDEYLAVITCFGTLTASDYTCVGNPSVPMLKPGVCAQERSKFTACGG